MKATQEKSPTKQARKSLRATVGAYYRAWTAFCARAPFLSMLYLSMALTATIEVLGRHSLWEAFVFCVTKPHFFLLDVLIVLSTLSLSLLMRRRNFALLVLSTVWLGLGIGNFVVLSMRVTPLSFIDLTLIESVISIINVYLNPFQIVLVLLGLFVALGALVFGFFKSNKHPIAYRRALCSVGGCAMAVMLAGSMVGSSEAVSEGFSNLSDAYSEYGFSYCFATSVIDRGIAQPDDYEQDTMEGLLVRLSEQSPWVTGDTPPNVIVVQLESFFDVNRLNTLTCTENPLPNFPALQAEYSSGYLSMPVIGAGTANAEFEMLCGMNLDFFGVGEYPYKSLLTDQTVPSAAHSFAQLGYDTTVMHNNDGTFYDRNLVFPNLGFDRFVSLEYMQNPSQNPIGWAEDEMLVGEILRAMDSSEARDFVYAISVQAHGKYPDEAVTPYAHYTVHDEHARYETPGFSYFLTQIAAVDAFVGEVVAEIEERVEPTVIVFFGDHVPNFSMEEEDFAVGDLFTTEYVIWDNIGLQKQTKDLEAYQLMAYVEERLELPSNPVNMLHRTEAQSEDYQNNLQLLQYDMLYGAGWAYGTQGVPQPTDMQMGTVPIVLDDVLAVQGGLRVSGQNFTPYSVVYIDGAAQDTTFVSDTTLFVPVWQEEDGVSISVAQQGKDSAVLSETVPHLLK